MAIQRAGQLATRDPNGYLYDECISSGELNTSQAVHGDSAQLRGIIILTDGTNNGTVTIYDNASAAIGTILFKMVVKGSDLVGGAINIKVKADNGLYLAISGTDCTAIVYYVDVN